MEKVKKINIDGLSVQVKNGQTILDAARSVNIHIPTLCHHDDLCIAGNCRVCVVEVKGKKGLVASCAMPTEEGMEITTNSLMVRNARKQIIELLLSEHDSRCTLCYKNGKCELQSLAAEYKITGDSFIDLVPFKNYQIDKLSPSVIKDDSKCIRCQRCVRTCNELQQVGALSMAYKGGETKISTFVESPLYEVVCTQCGQCINRCPTGALTEKNYLDPVWEAIFDHSKHVVVQTAPAVRVALGEELGIPSGEVVTGKMVAALQRLGFDSVMDTDFTADLTIMEEGTELLGRLEKVLKGGDNDVKLPLATSCSPGWVKFMEHLYPDFIDHMSTCKSPQQMFGALAKTYYAQKRNIDPKDIVSVSIMPCTAKKFEADRPEMRSSGYKDVDFVLTTRELAIMIRQAGIDFNSLEESDFDTLMGESTGAAVIFGATGGVMEAALRTVYELVTGREVPFDRLDILPVRGMDGIREAEVKIEGVLPEYDYLEGVTLKTAIAHGLVNARKLMEMIKKEGAMYHFIEIMACPGGCLGGGGQPLPTSKKIRDKRARAIYAEDAGKPIRKSHQNPEIKQIYEEFLHEPLGEMSHKLLHTKYRERIKF